MASSYGLEAAALQTIRPRLEEEGFEVFLNPSAAQLPNFLAGYQPDAIALRQDKKLAIEVATEDHGVGNKISHLQALLSGHDEWELRVVYVPKSEADVVRAVPREDIQGYLKRIESDQGVIGPVGTLLMGWSAFEAVGRYLVPDDFKRPQSSNRLIELLASQGYLLPEDADFLRWLGALRNKAAHGQLDISVSNDDLKRLISIGEKLLNFHQ